MKIGFIGCGNMGRAMLQGILESGFDCSNIIVSCATHKTKEIIEKEYQVQVTLDNQSVIKNSNVIILAIKPNKIDELLSTYDSSLYIDKTLVCISPGKNKNSFDHFIHSSTNVLITMPNTPSKVLYGVSAICRNNDIENSLFNDLVKIFECFSKVILIDEKDLAACVSVSGSAPAYMFYMIEAMIDSAVGLGMNRDIAFEFAVNTMLGSAMMLEKTKEHPVILKNEVCSPGGTTIKALESLEKNGFKSAIQEAMMSAYTKASTMK